MKALLTLLLAGFVLTGCERKEFKTKVALDFQIGLSASNDTKLLAPSADFIDDFNRLRDFLDSSDFENQLAARAGLAPTQFSLSVETLDAAVPFAITFKATSQAEIDKLIAATPGTTEAFITAQQLKIRFSKLKVEGH
jgi:hypothetical protein